MTLALSPLVVTPDDVRARTTETFLVDSDAVHAIFYVHSHEFATLSQELESLSDRLAGIHDAVPGVTAG